MNMNEIITRLNRIGKKLSYTDPFMAEKLAECVQALKAMESRDQEAPVDPPPTYRYFISYSHSAGFGCLDATMREPLEERIKNGHLKEFAKWMEVESKVKDLVILSFQRL